MPKTTAELLAEALQRGNRLMRELTMSDWRLQGYRDKMLGKAYRPPNSMDNGGAYDHGWERALEDLQEAKKERESAMPRKKKATPVSAESESPFVWGHICPQSENQEFEIKIYSHESGACLVRCEVGEYPNNFGERCYYPISFCPYCGEVL